LNGIINVLKPPGMTSFDIVANLRGILKTKKIGHTGTLDPAAVGVLPVCIGNATKAIEYLTDKDKFYRAEMILGIETDTQDSTGEITAVHEIDVTNEAIINVIERFKGKYDQLPPMYSAVKIDGKKLYELARKGITVERKLRELEIYAIDVLNIETFLIPEIEGSTKSVIKVLFDVKCSKGTYIRTLCADIGQRLGCGGHMSFLVRMSAGNFNITDALTLEEIKAKSDEKALSDIFIDVGIVFEGLEKVVLNIKDEKKLLNGVSVLLNNEKFKLGESIRIFSEVDKFLAIGEVLLIDNRLYLKSKKLFI